MKKRGFTLIELLIVISIIGVLMAAGVASYSNMQKKSRDARRRTDMTTLRNAYEQYYADNNQYLATCIGPGVIYLPDGFPKDPKTGNAYTNKACTDTTYCFSAELESVTTGTDCTGAAHTTGYTGWFTVKQLQ